MQNQEQNEVPLASKIRNAGEIVIASGKIVAEGSIIGAVTPIAAPIIACNEARKILVGAPDASYKKVQDASKVTAVIGGAGIVGVGIAAIFGAPLALGGALGAWLFASAASIKSDLSAKQNDATTANLEQQTDTTTTTSDIAEGLLEVQQSPHNTENLGDVITELLEAQQYME